MPLTKADLIVYQGDDYGATVLVTNEDGTPADITGYTAKAQIRRAVADSDPEVVAELSATVQSPHVVLGLTHAQTELLTGRYMWDLQLLTDESAIVTIMRGAVKVTNEVTRP